MGSNSKHRNNSPDLNDSPVEVDPYGDILDVPPTFEHLIPSPNFVVSQLCNLELPKRKAYLVTATVEECFKKQSPPDVYIDLIENLSHQPLPATDFISKAKIYATELAIPQGYKSIINPAQPTTRLPLWSLSYWSRMHEVVEGQEVWKSAKRWAEEGSVDETATGIALKKCLSLMESIGWREKLAGRVRGDTLCLAPILSRRMTRGATLDLMMGEVQARIEQADGALGREYEAVTLNFFDYVKLEWAQAQKPQTSAKKQDTSAQKQDDTTRKREKVNYLQQLKNRLTAEPKILLVPAHLRQKSHYIGVRIDFGARTISFGDSLQSLSDKPLDLPSEIRDPLQWWLTKEFGGPFQALGATIECRQQEDGISCGFTTVNMLSWEILQQPLWHPQRVISDRAGWFIRLVNRHLINKSSSDKSAVGPAAAPSVEQPGPQGGLSIQQLLRSPLAVSNNDSDTTKELCGEVESALSGEGEGMEWAGDDTYSMHSHAFEEPPLSSDAESMGWDMEYASSCCDDDVDRAEYVGIARNSEVEALGSAATEDGGNSDNAPHREAPVVSMLSTSCEELAPPSRIVEDAVAAAEVSKPQLLRKKSKPVLALHPFFAGAKRKREEEEEDAGKNVVVEEEGNGQGSGKKAAASNQSNHPSNRQRKMPSAGGGTSRLPASDTSTKKPFKVSLRKLKNFQAKCRELDSYAEVNELDPSLVRCSKCGQEKKMRKVYDIRNFTLHLSKCKGVPYGQKSILTGAGMSTLPQLFKGITQVSTPPTIAAIVPCPGITGAKATEYLERTPAPGGGGPTKSEIARELYNVPNLKGLSQEQKNIVWSQYHRQCTWTNDHKLKAVFSVDCVRIGRVDLYNKSLIHPNSDDPTKLKYTPKVWLDSNLVQKYGDITGLRPLIEAYEKDPRTPCLLYAIGVSKGNYQDDAIFTSLVDAMVKKKDKEERNVGMQGFQYAPDMKEFAHILSLASPRAYQSMRQVLALPTQRTFEINQEHIKGLGYRGPLALSCDDTQLLPALRPCYDTEKEKWYIIGGENGPLLLSDPEEFITIVDNAKVEKAKKMRLWCLQIPMPGIPTIIVAARGIGSNVAAPQLVEWQRELLDGLLGRGLHVVACAHDGSSLERSTQHLLEDDEHAAHQVLRIPHPASNGPDIIIKTLLYGKWKQPIAMLQDSQHGLKTARNNAYSGARLLVMGNHVVHYEHFRRIAMEGGPIYNRDVEKVDRQDDSAAIRLFSADTLAWMVEKHPECIGTIIFLFIFGELIDAYQNRQIPHHPRIKMALRAYFFLEIWECFLIKAGYDKSKHFISKEACDIMRFLALGLIKTVIIYRDTAPTYPLLPWLLMTEVCEHTFGTCRKILPDFTLLDFYYMVPKLLVHLRELELFQKLSNGKERASGYSHAYHDRRDMNLAALNTFPTDDEIKNELAAEAYEEAENLWNVVGFVPVYEQESAAPIPGGELQTFRWVVSTPRDFETAAGPTTPNANDDYDDALEPESTSKAEDAATRIEERLEMMEEMVLTSSKDEEEVNRLAFAAVSLSLDDSMQIHSLPELSKDEQLSEAQDLRKHLEDCLRVCSEDVVEVEAECDASLSNLTRNDFSTLVAHRRAHQRKQAETGTRKRVQAEAPTDDQVKTATRAQILRKLNDKIKELEERGVTTAVGRSLRLNASHAQPGRQAANQTGASNPSAKTGNALNAEEAEKRRVKRQQERRNEVYQPIRGDLRGLLRSARVTAASPLEAVAEGNRAFGFGFVLFERQLYLARVLIVYSRSGGKRGKHGWVPRVNAIDAASNIGVQLYEHRGLGTKTSTFRSQPRALASLKLQKFALISASDFLLQLSARPREVADGDLQVGQEDLELFQKLRENISTLLKAVETLKGKRAAKEDLGSDDE
ncbi:hypothetical protein MD484_g7863, partial [Candolleomyces efflorescens]